MHINFGGNFHKLYGQQKSCLFFFLTGSVMEQLNKMMNILDIIIVLNCSWLAYPVYGLHAVWL